MRPALRLVSAYDPLSLVERRVMWCDDCASPAVAVRTVTGEWTLRHSCRPRDTMRIEYLTAALCLGAAVFAVLAAAIWRWVS